MRKYIAVMVAVLLGPMTLCGADPIVGYISPTTTTSNVSISAPGAKFSNCLTYVSVTDNGNATVNILDGGTTVYAVDIATSSTQSPQLTPPLILTWPTDDPLCAGYNSIQRINISAGTFKINYRGQIRGNQ